MSAEPILSVKDLHVRFKSRQGRKFPWSPLNSIYAVNGVSFELPRGKTLGIVGESGCGKSTLIRAVAGLSPPTQGTVTLEGAPVNYARRSEIIDLRRRVQMIFQDPVASLNPRMTVRDIVEEPLRAFLPDLSSEERRVRVRSMLDRVSIPERSFNRYPHEFSGGQCQRIGIARALIARPSILLCDEPVSALDVSVQAQVINLLKELQAEFDLSLIFVAHDLGVVRHISDEVLVLYMGGMMERAEAGHIVSAPQHPYTRALLSSVPVPDPKIKVTPQVLDGDLPSPMMLPQGCLFESRCPKAQGVCQDKRPRFEATGKTSLACHLAHG
jgi:oligopeptide transport system ATP-binding protein